MGSKRSLRRMPWMFAVLLAASTYGVAAGSLGDHLGPAPDTWTVGAAANGTSGRFDYGIATAGAGYDELVPAVPLRRFDVGPEAGVIDQDGVERVRTPWTVQEGAYQRPWADSPMDTYVWALGPAHVEHWAAEGRIASVESADVPDYLGSDPLAPTLGTWSTANIPQGMFAGWRSEAESSAAWTDYSPVTPSCLQALRPGTWSTDAIAPFHACVLLAPVLAVSVGDPVREIPDPAYVPVVRLGAGQSFHALGTDLLEGRQTLVVQAGPMTVWLADGLPVPVQVTVEDGARTHVFRLQDFEPGILAPSRAEAFAPNTGLPIGPARPEGSDEAGYDHPYPPSLAWEDALQEASFLLFTTTHPEARVAAMTGRLDVRDQTWIDARLQWELLVSDGADARLVRVVVPFDPEGRPLGALANVTIEPALPLAPPTGLPAIRTLAHAAGAPTSGPAVWGFDGGPTPRFWFVHVDHDLQPGTDGALHGRSQESGTVVVGDQVQVRWGVHRTIDSGASVWTSDGSSGTPPVPAAAIHWTGPRAVQLPAAGLAVAVGTITLLLSRLPWAGLFSRIREARVLENPVRRTIWQIVQADPGIHLSEAARRAGVGHRTLVHHVGKLESTGLLRRQEGHGYVCLFPRSGDGTPPTPGAGSIRSTTARAILGTVLARPGRTLSEAAAEVGITVSTAHHHVHRMLDAGILRAETDGRTKRLFVTPAGRSVASATSDGPGSAIH